MSEFVGSFAASLGGLLVACGLMAASAKESATARFLGCQISLLGISLLLIHPQSNASTWTVAAVAPALGLALLLAGVRSSAAKVEMSDE